MHVGQEDPSQVFALASVWLLILGFGSSACLVPIVYTVTQAYQDAFNSGISYANQASALEFLATLNGMLFMLFGSMVGYPIASASGNEYGIKVLTLISRNIEFLTFVRDDNDILKILFTYIVL